MQQSQEGSAHAAAKGVSNKLFMNASTIFS